MLLGTFITLVNRALGEEGSQYPKPLEASYTHTHLYIWMRRLSRGAWRRGIGSVALATQQRWSRRSRVALVRLGAVGGLGVNLSLTVATVHLAGLAVTLRRCFCWAR